MTDITAGEYRIAEKVARSLGFATAQSYADHAARLESEGTVPAGGMALTAEQVEDVRTVVNNSPMEIYDAKERGLYYAAAARVRALFPATEPAEEAASQAGQTAQEGAPSHDRIAAGCKIRHACASASDPARRCPICEPAEEETKAEGPMQFRKKPVEVEAMQYDGEDWRSIAQWMAVHGAPIGRTASGLLRIHTLEGEMAAHPGDWIIKGTQGEFYPCKPAPFADTFEPASSPVVPAPTATGPWEDIEDVPKSVYLIKDCEGDKWRRDRKSWEVYSERGFRWHPGFPDRFAPFVAAEEG